MPVPLSIPRWFRLGCAIAAVVASMGGLEAATLTATAAQESASRNLPTIAGDGGLNDASLILFQNSGESITSSMASNDPTAAAARLASLSTDQDRAAASLVVQSMGSVDPEVIRQLVEQWQQDPDRTAIIEGNRQRGRGGKHIDPETALN